MAINSIHDNHHFYYIIHLPLSIFLFLFQGSEMQKYTGAVFSSPSCYIIISCFLDIYQIHYLYFLVMQNKQIVNHINQDVVIFEYSSFIIISRVLGTSNHKIKLDLHLFCTSTIITGNLCSSYPPSQGMTTEIGCFFLRCPIKSYF